MLGWEAQLNVRVTATSPTKSQTSDVITGSAKSRLEITYCYHQQNMDWHKASGVEESKWSCWRNCPFPSADDSPSKSSGQRRNGPKGHVLSLPDKEISSIHHGHVSSLQKPLVFPFGGSSRCHFQFFTIKFLTYRAGFLKFSGCPVTKSSFIWGALCDPLGRCLLQGTPPVLVGSGISWEESKVKLSTCPTATFYFLATSLSPAINPDWIYIPCTTSWTQLMASDTTNGLYIPLGSSPDNLFLWGQALQSCQWNLGAAEQFCVTLVFHMSMCGLRWEKPQKVMHWTIITSKRNK